MSSPGSSTPEDALAAQKRSDVRANLHWMYLPQWQAEVGGI